VLQSVAVSCSALQCVSVFEYLETSREHICYDGWGVYACCSVLPRVAACCSVLQCVAVRCSVCSVWNSEMCRATHKTHELLSHIMTHIPV